jgi:hypothetical protein
MIESISHFLKLVILAFGIFYSVLAVLDVTEEEKQTDLLFALECYAFLIAISVI